ncbi:MAG: hypothetical protein GTN98_03815 [Woeseiaceae bacterium]|nr:hypothetical protein [Woeseiaceae bacterium]
MSLFELAFPDSLAQQRRARARLRDRAEEPVDYCFSFAVARWLARRCPGELSIDWDAFDDSTRLDELLRQLLHPSEDEYFDSGWVSTRDWIDMAMAGFDGTDFDWLMAQLTDKRMQRVWTQLYDAAEVPLTWNLSASRYAKARNAFPVSRVVTRNHGMRSRPRFPKREILKPLRNIELLDARRGARLIDVAMASLATRHRETYHFNYANPREVYLASIGDGVSVAVFGLLPEHRFPLECTMGFLVLANGIPIGYGGSSVLFKQVNTGINIFDDFRGSEAAFLWTQVMRVYHQLVGCTRFIANPYQFGGDNTEALRSGAFWFYYRLGYRPVLPDIRRLAQQEDTRIRRDRAYRSNIKTLRRLASCDMHLLLPGARAGEFFDERWFDTVSMLATDALAAANGRARRKSSALAPIIEALSPDDWSRKDRRLMRELLQAKDGDRELVYARRLANNQKLLISLKKACRRAE